MAEEKNMKKEILINKTKQLLKKWLFKKFCVFGCAKRRLYISWFKSNPSIYRSDGSKSNNLLRKT